MNLECFEYELNVRLAGMGKVSVSSTSNIPNLPMPRVDTLWLVENVNDGVDFHIKGLSERTQTVIIDVPNCPSLDYILGSSATQVKKKAKTGAMGKTTNIHLVEQYIDIINEAYNGVVNYVNASVAFSQYLSTNVVSRLQQAWFYLHAIPLHFPKALILINSIQAEAYRTGIKL